MKWRKNVRSLVHLYACNGPYVMVESLKKVLFESRDYAIRLGWRSKSSKWQFLFVAMHFSIWQSALFQIGKYLLVGSISGTYSVKIGNENVRMPFNSVYFFSIFIICFHFSFYLHYFFSRIRNSNAFELEQQPRHNFWNNVLIIILLGMRYGYHWLPLQFSSTLL